MKIESFKQAKELILHNRINRISDSFWEIDNRNSVKLQVKKGRSFFSCSCQNSARFPIESFCYHKLAVVLFEAEIYKKLNTLIEEYQGYSKIKAPITTELILNDLMNLKR